MESFWLKIKALWPSLAELMASVATPQSWFVLFIFISAIFIFGGSKKTRPRRNEKQSNWYRQYGIPKLIDPALLRECEDIEDKLAALNEQIDALNSEEKAVTPPTSFGYRGYVEMGEPNPERDAIRQRKLPIVELFNKERQLRIGAQSKALENLHEKLANGSLVAKGFLQPVLPKDEEVDIPQSKWRFLRFNSDFTEASGEGITYTAVTVAKS